MSTPDIDNYYNRFSEDDNYEKHLVRAGYGVQSAEINEIQEAQITRLKNVADALFSDGDIVRDCQATVNADTGAVIMNSGSLYLVGAVRGVQPATFTIPIDQSVSIGIRLIETVITELDDEELRDPAVGTRNYNEAGAGRLKLEAVWGWDGDGGDGEFYDVYTVENGVLLSKEAPPSLDSVNTAIARYDRDSAGGNYIIDGLSVSSSLDRVADKFTVLIGEGRARVNGFGVDVPTSLRLLYDSDQDIKAIASEPHTYSPSGGSMRIDVEETPLVSITRIQITAEKTVTLTHGAFSGAKDALPDNSVLSLIEVKQGATTYIIGADCKLTSNEVDWSLTGAEPAPGSTYTVKYQYLTTAVTPTGIDDTGFTITGAVTGTLVTVDYTFALPRIDAIALDSEGRVSRIKGVASQYSVSSPSVPATMLKIGSIAHNWFQDPTTTNDAVTVLPMQSLQAMQSMVFDLYDLVAQERLKNSISLADPAAKRGVFVDPFNNDDLRDQGITQNLAIIDGELMLPVDPDVHAVGTTITSAQLLPYTVEAIINQPYKTGSMKVNPYQAFDPLPATLTLAPAVDFWTSVQTVWTSSITKRIVQGNGRGATTTTTSSQIVSTTTANAEYLRQIEVKFNLSGFGPGEILNSVTFDGISVTFGAQ